MAVITLRLSLLVACALIGRASALTAVTARTVAHSVLLRCQKSGAFADRALAAALDQAQLPSRDARLATELTYGVLRNTRSLDFVLSQLTTLERTRAEDLVSLRVGAYELLHLRTPDHAAVSEAVDTAKREGARRFLNGVLRNVARKRDSLNALTAEQALGVRCSMPDWLLDELAASVLPQPAALDAWAHANQRTPRVALRVNPLRASPADVLAKLEAAGLTAARVEGMPHALLLEGGGGDVARLPGFAEGEFTVQDPAAQLVALLAAPRGGDVVLDLCAAPGGKTTHLAELMRDRGALLSLELHPRKLKLIEASCKRLGLTVASPRAADATDAPLVRRLLAQLLSESGDAGGGGGDAEEAAEEAEAVEAGAESADGGGTGAGGGGAVPVEEEEQRLADVVVLDAPCSGFGTLRRNPEHRAKLSKDADVASNLAGLHALQVVMPLPRSLTSPVLPSLLPSLLSHLSSRLSSLIPPLSSLLPPLLPSLLPSLTPTSSRAAGPSARLGRELRQAGRLAHVRRVHAADRRV